MNLVSLKVTENCLKMLFGNFNIGIFVAVCLIREILSLKDVQSIVPQSVKIHDSVMLQCKFDLEKDTLYTVKWYKGMHEFFRYVPKEDPQMHIFQVEPKLNVDLSRSSMNEVVLLDIQPENSGKYLCEVTTDLPDFLTTMASGYMNVIDVPEGSPVMEISKESTKFGEKIKANCTTPPSFPAMNVTWYVNGIKVPETSRRSVSFDPYSKKRGTPYMTLSQLEKEIDENVFQGGVIRVQCIATVFNLYKSENVRYIDDNSPQRWQSSVSFTENYSYSGSNRIQYVTQILLLLASFHIFAYIF